MGPGEGSCHHRDGDARLLATGGEPGTELLLGVAARGGQVGPAGGRVTVAGRANMSIREAQYRYRDRRRWRYVPATLRQMGRLSLIIRCLARLLC